VIPREIVAFGLLIEPLFVVVSEFEDRHTQFFMRERLPARCDARVKQL
jgi:hypothetical protein